MTQRLMKQSNPASLDKAKQGIFSLVEVNRLDQQAQLNIAAFFFLAIRQEVVPLLKTYPSIKIWIAGCSTGEEVYSMAILLREEGLLERTIIYATDINPASLDKAKFR